MEILPPSPPCLSISRSPSLSFSGFSLLEGTTASKAALARLHGWYSHRVRWDLKDRLKRKAEKAEVEKKMSGDETQFKFQEQAGEQKHWGHDKQSSIINRKKNACIGWGRPNRKCPPVALFTLFSGFYCSEIAGCFEPGRSFEVLTSQINLSLISREPDTVHMCGIAF